MDRLWDLVKSTDDDIADTTPQMSVNRDRQVRLEASVDANAILSRRRAIQDHVATITAQALDMTEYP